MSFHRGSELLVEVLVLLVKLFALRVNFLVQLVAAIRELLAEPVKILDVVFVVRHSLLGA